MNGSFCFTQSCTIRRILQHRGKVRSSIAGLNGSNSVSAVVAIRGVLLSGGCLNSYVKKLLKYVQRCDSRKRNAKNTFDYVDTRIRTYTSTHIPTDTMGLTGSIPGFDAAPL